MSSGKVSGRALIAPAFAPSRNFPLGVMAGDMRQDSAVVWTRYAGREPLRLTVAEEQGGKVVFDQLVAPKAGGFAHVDVKGLTAGTGYRYSFAAGQEQQQGRFKTALDPASTEPVTFGATSCTNFDEKPFRTLENAAGRPLDFFVYGGDNVYCDGARTAEDFRAKYAEVWSEPGAAKLHASTGAYVTWDDHEVDNNWNPEEIDPAKLKAALDTFFEHQPLRVDAKAPGRLWRKYQWGKAAEVFVLDCKTERTPSSGAQYLSPEQMGWLKQGLKESTAAFKFIINSSPIGDVAKINLLGESDRWSGYPGPRRELLDFIHDNGLKGVWFISGDFHFSTVGRVGRPGSKDFALREALVGPGANPKLFGVPGPDEQLEFTAGKNNFSVFRADPQDKTLQISVHGEDGRALFTGKYDQDGNRVRGPAVPQAPRPAA